MIRKSILLALFLVFSSVNGEVKETLNKKAEKYFQSQFTSIEVYGNITYGGYFIEALIGEKLERKNLLLDLRTSFSLLKCDGY